MYSPKIRENYVRQLYLLKQADKRPMTQMVNEAVEQYLLINPITTTNKRDTR